MSQDPPREPEANEKPLAHEEYYYEGDLIVFTAAYHLKRGYCCGSGCRHCPYEKKQVDSEKPQSSKLSD